MAKKPNQLHIDALNTSLVLYAEHEFNASTFTARVIAGTLSDLYSCITGAIGALRGAKHGGANEAAMEIISRYQTADEAEADILARMAQKEIIIGFGHPVYTISDPRNESIKEVSRKLSEDNGNMTLFDISARIEATMWREKKNVPQLRLVQRVELSHDGHPHEHVYANFCDCAHHWLGCPCHRTTQGQ